MASSYKKYKEEVREYILGRFSTDIEILDVGAGCGTYKDLLKEYKKMDAVEVFKPNIRNYNLESKYRNVYNVNICDFTYEYYGLVIFGDILEHLEVEEAQEVLDYAMEHSKEVLVALPYLYEQGIEENNVYEIHKQADLTPEIVLKRYPRLKLLFGDNLYGYYVKLTEEE